MPHYTPILKPLDALEAVAVLPKFVWPRVNDKAKVSTPIPGNRITAGVYIEYGGDSITMTTVQYEKFRIGVLIPVTEQYLLSPFTVYEHNLAAIEKYATELIEQVFADD